MTKYAIGDVVMANGWPSVVLEANRSEKPDGTVLCAVFGWEIDYGSVYVRDVYATDFETALSQVDERGRDEFTRVYEKHRKIGERKAAAKARAAARKATPAD